MSDIGSGGRRKRGKYAVINATIAFDLKEKIRELDSGYGKISAFVEKAVRNELKRSSNGDDVDKETLKLIAAVEQIIIALKDFSVSSAGKRKFIISESFVEASEDAFDMSIKFLHYMNVLTELKPEMFNHPEHLNIRNDVERRIFQIASEFGSEESVRKELADSKKQIEEEVNSTNAQSFWWKLKSRLSLGRLA